MGKSRVVIYSPDPWESAVSMLRLVLPLTQTGFELIRGREGEQIDPNRVDDADWVVIQRNFPMYKEACTRIVELAHQQNKPVIYETDDLLLELPQTHPMYDALRDSLFATLRTAMEADLVTVSSAYLADYFRPFNPAVVILPNVLDGSIWRIQPHEVKPSSQPLVIGYMGSSSHASDLQMIVPVLNDVLDAYPDEVCLHFWGCPPPEALAGHSRVAWTGLDLKDYKQFADYFSEQHADIWVAPLEDNRFNRSKSDIKFLEYAASGGAGVFSRLEPYESTVTQGKNGFLASNLEEWRAFLTLLIEKADLRQQIASAARDTIKGKTLSNHHADWQAAYQSAYVRMQHPDLQRKAQLETFYRLSNQVEDRHAELQQAISTLWGQVHSLDKQLNETSAQLRDMQNQLEETGSQLQEAHSQAQDYLNELNNIYNSRSWKTLQKARKIRQTLIPVNPKEKNSHD